MQAGGHIDVGQTIVGSQVVYSTSPDHVAIDFQFDSTGSSRVDDLAERRIALVVADQQQLDTGHILFDPRQCLD